MRFDLVDTVLSLTDTEIVAVKRVSRAEEYLEDHFPTYPVLPGVMMLEAMVQAGRRLAIHAGHDPWPPLVLGEVRALRYARFVQPGWSLVSRVTLDKAEGEAGALSLTFKGQAHAVEHDTSSYEDAPVAASGRFTLRPPRLLASEVDPLATTSAAR